MTTYGGGGGGYISDTWQLEVIRATVIILPGFVTRIRNTDLIIEEITAAISASYRSTCFSRNNYYPTRDSSLASFRFVQFLEISNSDRNKFLFSKMFAVDRFPLFVMDFYRGYTIEISRNRNIQLLDLNFEYEYI